MGMSNRVEELEATVAELESTVDGLTEELVAAKERIRELESELESARTDEESSDTPDREEFERMKRKLERARGESGEDPEARRREAGPEDVAAAAPDPGEDECFETTTEPATENPDETDDFEREDEIIIA